MSDLSSNDEDEDEEQLYDRPSRGGLGARSQVKGKGKGKGKGKKGQPDINDSGKGRRTVAFVSSSTGSHSLQPEQAPPAAKPSSSRPIDVDDMTSQKFAGLIHSNQDFRDSLQMAGGGEPEKAPPPPPPPPPSSQSLPADMGAWQKHTKGIGLKLLQKFGFTGRLGAKEDGIIRPVDVVSRPTGEGLGFGKKEKKTVVVDEKSNANTNKMPEKRARGLPGTEEIADGKSWKKGRSEKVKILDVADFLNGNGGDEGKNPVDASTQRTQSIVLDMRGEKVRILDMKNVSSKGSESATDSMTSQPKLGQELLYNVNLIVDLTEAHVTKHSHKSSEEESRMASCKMDMAILEKELTRDLTKLERINKIIEALTRIDAKRNTDAAAISLDAVTKAITSLYEAFAEEFRLFGVLQLLPTLAEPILKSLCVDWNPMLDPARVADVAFELSPLIDFFAVRQENGLANQTQKIIETMFESAFLPIVRRSIVNAWDVQAPDSCIFLLKTLYTILPETTMTPLLDTMIQPKLVNGIRDWSSQSAGAVPLHNWLLPWLPMLGHRLGQLLPDVRKKLGQELKLWHVKDSKGLSILTPWLEVFDATSAHNLLIRSIVPKLVEGLREMTFEENDQGVSILQSVLKWYGFVPQFHLNCVLEGEFFPRWLQALSKMLQDAVDFDVVSDWYTSWKIAIPDELFASEERIRQPFNVALELMQQSMDVDADPSSFAYEIPTVSSGNSYLDVLEKRKRESKAPSDLVPGNSSTDDKRKMSLKELAETMAETNGILFLPRADTFDGEKLYSFGSQSILFRQDVVFAKTTGSSAYAPISLQRLLELSMAES